MVDQEVGEDVVLTDKQVEKIVSIARGRYPVDYDPFEPLAPPPPTEVDPISDLPKGKRSLLPSADERRMVSKMVHAIKMGWMKLDDESDDGSDYEERTARVEVG